jgi:hypothetical protein
MTVFIFSNPVAGVNATGRETSVNSGLFSRHRDIPVPLDAGGSFLAAGPRLSGNRDDPWRVTSH